MKQIKVWLETGYAGERHEDIINVPRDTSEKELEQLAKETAFNTIDWGYYEINDNQNERIMEKKLPKENQQRQ